MIVLDSFLEMLATHPIPNQRAKLVVAAVLEIFSREMGIPSRVITDHGSEFVSTDTRALLQSKLGVKMSFIPAGKHQQSLVECAHGTLWGVI